VTFSPKFSLFPECSDQLGAATHPGQGLATSLAQLGQVARAEVGQLALYEIAPDVFGRIEFRRIGGQRLDPDFPIQAIQIVLHQTAAVNGCAIPNHRELAADVPLEMFEELNDLRALDRAGVESEIEVPESQTRNHRKALPVEVVLQHWGLAAPGPGAHPVRSLAQAAFVDEDQDALFRDGLFFKREYFVSLFFKSFDRRKAKVLVI